MIVYWTKTVHIIPNYIISILYLNIISYYVLYYQTRCSLLNKARQKSLMIPGYPQ